MFFIENIESYLAQCSRYTKMGFAISFTLQKRAKVTITTILKYLEPLIVVEQF